MCSNSILFIISIYSPFSHSSVFSFKTGKITVHNPVKLGSDVLNKYFRHSKYASFQRQLNYFGFRKLEGKGKMSPCSYINETTTTDIRSLLTVKVSFISLLYIMNSWNIYCEKDLIKNSPYV